MRALRHLATLGPIGFSPIAPASGASAVTALIGWFVPTPPLLWAIAIIAAGAALAIWICHVAEKELGHDAHPIVADEVVGQSIALILVPQSLLAYFLAFALFRVFDVWKPLGAREAQALGGGLGIVADDVIAGLTACGAVHLSLWVARAAGFPI